MVDYYKMVDHWTENGPPVYMAVAGYLGLIKEKKKGDKPSGSGNSSNDAKRYGNLEELAAMFNGTGGMIQ